MESRKRQLLVFLLMIAEPDPWWDPVTEIQMCGKLSPQVKSRVNADYTD